ncbi:MAG TPA: transglutaminase-like domain-containing protein, partial [Nocardioides sp.]|uniref:transglutaminase-like domain-containing protein n=1 Tax=Nocardioides sp. TaxID=35761 RepID=UPI002BD47600
MSTRWREACVDGAFLLTLSGAALLGLAGTFTGWQFWLVGMAGVLLGGGLTVLSQARGWPILAPALLVTVAFFLLGGVLCLRTSDAAPPTPAGWRLLTDQLLHGWKDLLTTLPPVDGSGPLLVLPWALGLLAGAVGMALARLGAGPRWLRAAAPLVAPTALLVVVILLGLARPQSLWVQGVVFAGTALAWLVVRGQRTPVSVSGGRGVVGRLLAGAALLGLAALLALPVGTFALGSDTHREILRTRVDPPFDVGQYPSPLASFRRFVKYPRTPPPENLYDATLFTVRGVPAGTRVRLAALDRYDGVVWGAANHTIPGATNDTYQRVSSLVDNPVEGRPVTATVTVGEGYSGVWLPLVGALQSLTFRAGDVDAKEESFRYNLAAATAVVPAGVHPGDRYAFTAVLPDDTLDPDAAPYPAVGEAAGAAAFLQTQAQEWTSAETDPVRRVLAAARHLKEEGKYSDGVAQAEKAFYAGHHERRLGPDFVNAPIMAGNDEQYAAVMALLANRIGVPARVVMGAVLPEGGRVTGADVSAWVELQVADGSWRTLPTEMFMGRERPAKLPPQSRRQLTGVNIPPPAPVPPPSVTGDQTEAEAKPRHQQSTEDDHATAGGLPGWVRALLVGVAAPLLALATVLAGVVLAKVGRRRYRRRRGRASARIVGAWRELVDHARDLGRPVPVG